jgi:cellulose synthase/poly-beta-1,6-N-acetylglucosamine synthase-like glycosyltransferase/peptidoglycan/xylan/chitin deacetylase (PgdA/CDA1 family)/spore germination protein YaaH
MAELDDALFVFRDKAGKRWPRLRFLLLLCSLLSFLAAVLFVWFLLITPQLKLPLAVQELRAHLRSGVPHGTGGGGSGIPAPLWLRFSKTRGLAPAAAPPSAPAPASSATSAGSAEIRLGFYVSWDPASHDSLLAHGGQLTHISPEWLTLVDGEGNMAVHPDRRLLEAARDNHLVVLPLLRNLVDDAWQPEAVEGLINGPPARQDRFINQLLDHLQEAEAGGVLIDWNQVDPAYRQQLTRLLQRLAAALHRQDMQLWLCIPVGLELKLFDLEALSPIVDRFVALLHDENSESDPPGPLASQPWFDGWLQTLLSYGDPAQWVVAIGAYGYDRAGGEKEARVVSFADAMALAGRAGVQECRAQAPLYNPSFTYMDNDTEHQVWFLDGVTFANQARAARALHAGGIAVSRLGVEDPALWEVFSAAQPGPVSSGFLELLRPLRPQEGVAQIGGGNFLMVDDSPAAGYREIAPDGAGRLESAYKLFPVYTTISHQGKGQPDEVALSFDDGPDSDWTPAILDILKARGVKASFFMVGDRMEEHPELVERILREGHEIGVHTYTHPNLAEVSDERARLEFNATQRLIETITGHSTFLFRPPYNADSRPHAPAELVPVKVAQQLGYLTVASDIDPEDWSRPGTEVIVRRVREQRGQGNVILLHDAGGNRGETVAALPLIIDYLQERGDRIVSLSRLLGAPAATLMPPLPKNQQPLLRLVGDSGFRILHLLGELGWAFMIVATTLVTLRTLAVALLAQWNRYRLARPAATAAVAQPPVSIVIAAFNEEKVIGRTLENLLHTDYTGEMEIIVVDDGSTDRTATVTTDIAASEPRLHLIGQPNLGKARALRAGFQAARHEIIVTLDADTLFQPDTIPQLVRQIGDEKTGAVSGHVKVGNLRTTVARFQDLEYTCGFNLDRRAYQQLNCITVVPGAASVWRRSAVMAAGGISSDTLAEDTDLTLCLHRAGYRIGYAPQAIAWTEAPESWATLARQRFRWAFGTLQCLWKHRDLVGSSPNRALGWFSLPSIWFFQILLVAISPLVDGLLLFSLFFGMGLPVLFYLLVFLGTDLLLAAIACWMEAEPLRHAWRILPMRFLYRPLLAWVVWKSLIRAAKGALVGWGKLERSASMALLLALLCLLPGCREREPAASRPAADTAAGCATLIFPAEGAYTGAYIDFGEYEDEVTLEAIAKFEELAGKHQAVIASSSYWGEQSFPRKNVELICRHGSVPLLFWSPWDRPYVEERPPDRFSLDSILAGKWDSYIDQWADAARAFDKPLLVSWGLEMNGAWFPWSGVHYGGGAPVGGESGQPAKFAGPERYKAAYRYVVGRVRARGASKILWVFHGNNLSFPAAPWNTLANYYPGADVVDILALSVYGKLFADSPWVSLEAAMDSSYRELCGLDPHKPVMVAEWGVGEFPQSGDKAAWITQAFALFKTRYTRVKAAVYWHERWQNKDETHSNLRINSSPEALRAYRQGAADPYWHGNPGQR